MSSSPTDTAIVVDVPMPQVGTSIAEATIVAWHKQVGDAVVADEPLFDITTDKVDSEIPSPASGVLAEILAGDGETVDVGTVVARIVPAGAAPAPPPRRYSPVVSRIAAEHGIQLDSVTGTGRNGRVTKKDVLTHLERGSGEPRLHSESPYRPDEPAPAPERPAVQADGDLGAEVVPLSRMRQSIAAAMLRSQQTAATAHTVVECDMTQVERVRRELGVTALPVVARAVVGALKAFPDLNATLTDDGLTRFGDRVHLGIAVSLGGAGLIVPVIHDAQDLSVEGIARRVRDLAARARDKRLEPREVQGATFTITSPGAAGAMIATPIINVPQVAILDLEAIVRRPVVLRDADGNESIGIRSMANFVLGWDHRAVDGMYAAQFLTALRGRLEAAGR